MKRRLLGYTGGELERQAALVVLRSGRGRGSIGTPICYRSVNTQVIKSRIKDCTKELKIDAVTYSYTD